MTFQFCNGIGLPLDCRVWEVSMKDLYQVLREKELDLERIRKEIEALRYVTSMLAEESETDKNAKPSLVSPSQSRWTGSGI